MADKEYKKKPIRLQTENITLKLKVIVYIPDYFSSIRHHFCLKIERKFLNYINSVSQKSQYKTQKIIK